MMSPGLDKLVRRTTVVATVITSYFLLTADYGPEPNVLDPVKNAILTAQNRVKDFVLGSSNKPKGNQTGNSGSNNGQGQP